MSVQEYASDALAPQYDSTTILVNRLSNWKYTIEYLINYFQNYYTMQKQTSTSLDKLRKQLNDPPQFIASRGETTKKDKKDPKEELTTLPPQAGTFGNAFITLQRKTELLTTQSESAGQNIKNNILPQLQSALKDIEQQYKHLKSSNSKLHKAIEKSRDQTEKLIEKLGKYTASVGHVDSADDPYVLKRRLKASIAEQVQCENESAEQGLALQNNFLAFEEHLVGTIQSSMVNMQHIVETFGTAQIGAQADIANSFSSIDKASEWSEFLSHNKDHLVPSTGYQRAVDNVTFTNENDPSTKPIISGHLTRTTTVLRKLQTSFYAVTASGYLQEFKSEDATSDPTPTLSLYLPHSVLGTLPPPSCTDYTFKIDSKDSKKKLSRGHSYQFRASSYDELGEWYYAIARKCLPEQPSSPHPDSGEAAVVPGAAVAASESSPVTHEPTASYGTDSASAHDTLGSNNPFAGAAPVSYNPPVVESSSPISPTVDHDGLVSPQSPVVSAIHPQDDSVPGHSVTKD